MILFLRRTSKKCASTILVIIVVLSSCVRSQWISITETPDSTNHANVDQARSLLKSFRRVSEIALPVLVTIHTPNPSVVDKQEPSQLHNADALSGFIVDSSGIILTNHHVIEGRRPSSSVFPVEENFKLPTFVRTREVIWPSSASMELGKYREQY